MQVSANSGYRHYAFPAIESFADNGKVVLMSNIDTISVYTYGSAGISIHDFAPVNSTRNFTPVEDDNTPSGQSLNFCGIYSTTWYASILPATPATINSCVTGAAPVALSSFNYNVAGNAVTLNWQTGSEANSDYFDVQRSSDGINFTTIGKIKAAGTSSTLRNYTLTDTKPMYLNHYRLSLVDLDGHSSFSKVLFVRCKKGMPFEIIQNHVSNTLQLKINDLPAATGHFIIYDLSGRLISASKAKAGLQDIDVLNLAKGNYLICLSLNDGQAYTQKFQKR